MSYANSPSKYKTTLIIQNYSHFLSRMTKGKSSRGHHLIITKRASILILISIVITIIAILIRRSLWRKKRRKGETTEASLLSCNTKGVHLTQLITETIKASIHALKLRHNGLEGHTTNQRRRNKGGRNSRGWRIGYLYLRPLQSKLGLTLPNRSCTDGTHEGVIGRIRNRDRKMAKDPHDSQRKKMSLSL